MTGIGSIRPVDLRAFSHVEDGRLRLLLAHWLAMRGSAHAPPRTAIDPTAIGPILASIWMCDFQAATGRFRMRLAGEDVNRLYGRNVGQCYFEDIIAPGMLDDVMRRYRRVIEEPAILRCAGHIYLASGRSEIGERLVLPLLDESGAMTHLIGASVYRLRLAVADVPILRESMVETFTPLMQPAA